MLGLFSGALFRQAIVALAVLLVTAGTLFSNSNQPAKPPERLIAIGDIHGDFDDFVLLLKQAGLVDAANHWSGGNSTLVQTGDLIDRGPKGRQVMDLLMSLEKEAASAGGKVLVLLGNHEVMNMLGDLRYVPAEDYASFADGESEKRRKMAYQEYAAWYAGHTEILAAITEPKLGLTEQEWMQKHPDGFLEYRDALSPEGKYGKWLRQHFAVAKIGATIFLHGGIHPNLISLKLDQINTRIAEEIAEFDKTKQLLLSRKLILPFFTIQEITAAVQAQLLAEGAADAPVDPEYHARLVKLRDFNNWLCMREDGPLWFRGYDSWSDTEGSAQMDKILAAYEAKHIVVGHTVQKLAHIRCRFEGQACLIDTGMLSSYWKGGRASALEIVDGNKFVAEYLDSREVLFDEKPLPASEKGN
jgi:predicted MPP superfamily phosphohydrolase